MGYAAGSAKAKEALPTAMWRTGAILSLLTLLSQLLQLGVQLALARLYGTGGQVDAYVAAVTWPQLIASLLVATSSQLVVPALAKERVAGPKSYARARTAVLCWIAVLASLTALLFALFPGPLVRVLFPGLAADAADLAQQYLPIAGVALVPGAMQVYLAQTHNVRERYSSPAVVGVASAALTLAVFFLLHPLYGVAALLYAQLAAALAGALALLVSEFAGAWGPIALFHPVVGKLARLTAPVAVIAINTRVNVTVDRFFGSMAGEGALALLHYADRWIGLTQAVLIMPFITVLYTQMSKSAAQKGRLGETGRRALSAMLYLGLPLALGTWVAAPDLAALLLSGAHSSPGAGPAMLGSCLRAYVAALALAGLGSVLVRAFYAREETRLAMWVAGLAPMALNALLDATLVRSWGVVGLAAVTSGVAVSVIAALLALLARREPGLLGLSLAKEAGRGLAGCASFWPLSWVIGALLGGPSMGSVALRLAVLALSGAGAYLLITRALGSQEGGEILALRRGLAREVPAESGPGES